MKKILFIMMSFGMLWGLLAQTFDTFLVKYVSSENNLYLDSGKNKGLAIRDTLIVFRGQEVTAKVVVQFVAAHSAACKILQIYKPVKSGDMARISGKSKRRSFQRSRRSKKRVIRDRTQQPQQPQKSQKSQKFRQSRQPRRSRQSQQRFSALPRKNRVSGNFSFLLAHFSDRGRRNRDLTQPTLRMTFKAKQLWDKDFNLRFRGLIRHQQRSRIYSNNVPEREWLNRIYEFALSYDNPQNPFHFQIGRITANPIRGVGPIDGALLQQKISLASRIGVFAGKQTSEWYWGPGREFRKYGGYLSFVNAEDAYFRFETTIAAVGMYRDSTIHREFLYFQNNLRWGRRLSLYQSADVQVYRGWRNLRTGKYLDISNLWVNLLYQMRPNLTLRISYDTRKNDRDYETRLLPDSLFNEIWLHGLQGNLVWQLPGQVSVYATGGARRRKNTIGTSFGYSGGIQLANAFDRRLNIHAGYNRFRSDISRGGSVLLDVGQSFSQGRRLNMGYVRSFYRYGIYSRGYAFHSLRLSGYRSLAESYYLNGRLEHYWGSVLNGDRVSLEIGRWF